ncbi:MAG: hypothetical protein RIS45_1410 [Planctomycetota bacterium]|jgi:diadenosine tetraphosphate (Ap4A) HIT family hydrolase
MSQSAADCPFCNRAQTIYLESPRWWLLRHADPIALEAWMMVASRSHFGGLDELPPEEQAELGVVLAEVARAVRAETGCERTYTISFNEAVRHLHVHVVPRHASDASTTSWALADRYRATARKERAPADPAETERVARAVAARCAPALAKLGFQHPPAKPSDGSHA